MKHLKKFNEGWADSGDRYDDTTPNKKDYAPGSLGDDSDSDFGDIPSNDNELNLRGWKFSDVLDKCISSNVKEIPYEGTEIDKEGIKDSIISWLEESGYKIVKK
jgi:hypothetical protein